MLGLVAAGLLYGENSKGKQVVMDAVAGLGGERFTGMKTRVDTGVAYSFYRSQVMGRDLATFYVQYLDPAPEKGLAVEEREAFGKKQDYSILLMSEAGYEVNYRGARPLSDEQWRRYVTSTSTNVLYLLRTRLNDPKLEYDFVREDIVSNTHVNIVDIIDGDRTIRVYFDYNTKVPIRQEYREWDPIGKQKSEETTDYSKYREVGGCRWPFVIHRERNGETTYEMFADSVTVDAPIPPGTFQLPTSEKILKKE
jgi:hypothetical protein